MPPLDMSIIQSLLLTLVLPSCGVAAGILGLAFVVTRSEVARSIIASIAFIAALAAGNYRGQLVPFLAIQRHAETFETQQERRSTDGLFAWESENGWYSLFSVTVVVELAEIAIDGIVRHKGKSSWATLIVVVATTITSLWLTPQKPHLSRLWICIALAVVALLNTVSLRRVGRLKCGQWVPLIVATVWCGSATAIVVLAHSARFADLGILLSCSVASVGVLSLTVRQRLVGFYSGPATFIPGLMLGAAQNTYSEVPWVSFALIAAAPALLILLLFPKLREFFDTRPSLKAIVFVIPCALAVALAMRAEYS